MVTFVVAAVAIATFVVAWRYGRRVVLRLAFLLALGVPAQAVIGGVTVLTDLNPWVVSFHLLVSLAMVGLAVICSVAWARATGHAGRSCRPGSAGSRAPSSWSAGWCSTSARW